MSKFKVCLTGGIASGKTYVSDQFLNLGAHVIDADILARQVVMPGTEGLAQLIETFGVGILKADKTLNRGFLKSLVFHDRQQLVKLNSIMHPLIKRSFQEMSSSNQSGLELWVIPLFNEESGYNDFNRILVIDVNKGIQIGRVKKRDGVNTEIARSMINSQPSRKARLKLASDVIVNNKDLRVLDGSILQIHKMYDGMMSRQSV